MPLPELRLNGLCHLRLTVLRTSAVGRKWGRPELNRDTVWSRKAARCKSVKIRGAGLSRTPGDDWPSAVTCDYPQGADPSLFLTVWGRGRLFADL